jgi:hypothetical protein
MARGLTNKSSLDVAIEEATKFGASVEEAKRVHSVVSANTTPDIQGFQVKYGPDSNDELAIWVRLFVDENLSLSDEKVANLNRTATKIRSELLKENLRLWPYVIVRSSA